MKRLVLWMMCVLLFIGCKTGDGEKPIIEEPPVEAPEPLGVGYSVPITGINAAKMEYAKSVGIGYVETSGTGTFFDDNRNFKKSDSEATSIMRNAKKAADDAGVVIWSTHMAFSEKMDLSTINEDDRKKVVAAHIKLIEYLAILKPKYILFHPSYYLDPPNQRDLRKNQLIKSVTELNVAIQAIGSTMVIENMLGPELMSGTRERPLMRSVEETVEIFRRLPSTVYSAIDMNHIKNPEILIRAMGKRLKSVHIADGTGKAENHWFPCSGQGENDWTEILKALDEVGYSGPFLYESDYNDEKDLVQCYQTLYNKFINSK